ncbi:MAG: hypothetical protein IKR33_05105 [Bacteroidales bacterium]|nr:hypothetical protein [Bacteroidales bacterium]
MKKTMILCLMGLFGLMGAESMAQNGAWTIYDTRTSDIGGNNIAAIAPDSRGVWVGTYQGLSRLNGGSWMDYSMFNEKLKDQSINCLMTDERGVVWIGTDDYGVIEFDGTHWTEHSAETRRLKMKFVKEIVKDQDGVVWIGVTLGGIVSYDGSMWEKYTPEDCALVSDFILDIAVDRANRKWITTNAGVSVFNDRSWTSYTSHDSGLPDDIVPAIAIDKNNIKWFGTLSGLASFDGENWQVWNTSNSPLPDNQINDIDIDADGLMWIATSNGAAVFDGVDRWVVFTAKNSPLPQGNIYKVRSDARGNHWFGNDARGLAKLSGFQMPERTVAATDNGRGQQRGNQQPTTTSTGTGDENVRINPHLEDGYVTITIESPSAAVIFINKDGKTVKTIPSYKNGQKINIRNMQKGMYTVVVKTIRGERKIKFNLK